MRAHMTLIYCLLLSTEVVAKCLLQTDNVSTDILALFCESTSISQFIQNF